MRRFSTLLAVSALVVGCDFDGAYLRDLQEPAVLVIRNNTDVDVELSSVYSDPDATATFVFPATRVLSSSEKTFRVREVDYEVLQAGKFVVEGRCGSAPTWRRLGTDFPRQAIRNAAEWKLTLSIATCPPAAQVP